MYLNPTAVCSNAGIYTTSPHEVIHSTGHVSRLQRDLSGRFGSKAYAREELVAELGSALLGDQLEIGSAIENHAAYLGHWVELLKETPQVPYQVLGEARRAVELVRNQLDSCGSAMTGPPNPTPMIQRNAIDEPLTAGRFLAEVLAIGRGHERSRRSRLGTWQHLLEHLQPGITQRKFVVSRGIGQQPRTGDEHVSAHDVLEQELVASIQIAEPLELTDTALCQGGHLGFLEPGLGLHHRCG